MNNQVVRIYLHLQCFLFNWNLWIWNWTLFWFLIWNYAFFCFQLKLGPERPSCASCPLRVKRFSAGYVNFCKCSTIFEIQFPAKHDACYDVVYKCLIFSKISRLLKFKTANIFYTQAHVMNNICLYKIYLSLISLLAWNWKS